MPARSSFEYAILRVVPRADREEFLNAGVILFCLARGYLAARVHLDPARLAALCPTADCSQASRHLEAIPRICAGDLGAGPIARLATKDRWHVLISPKSALIQVSAVHAGLCDDPAQALDSLMARMVLPSSAPTVAGGEA